MSSFYSRGKMEVLIKLMDASKNGVHFLERSLDSMTNCW